VGKKLSQVSRRTEQVREKTYTEGPEEGTNETEKEQPGLRSFQIKRNQENPRKSAQPDRNWPPLIGSHANAKQKTVISVRTPIRQNTGSRKTKYVETFRSPSFLQKPMDKKEWSGGTQQPFVDC